MRCKFSPLFLSALRFKIGSIMKTVGWIQNQNLLYQVHLNIYVRYENSFNIEICSSIHI